MIVKSNLKYATFIPTKGKSVLIAPTNNTLTDKEYSLIKDVKAYNDYVSKGDFKEVGVSEKSDVVNLKVDEVIEDSFGGTITGLTPVEALEIIKDTYVIDDLKEALKVEKRRKVRKALNEQLKALETKESDEDEKEEIVESEKSESLFLD